MKQLVKNLVGNWFDGVANSDKKQSKELISFIVKLLLEDSKWLLKNIKQKDALAIVKCLEHFANTGKRKV